MAQPLHLHKFTIKIKIKRELATLFDLREVSTALSDLDDVIASLFPTGSTFDPTSMRVQSGYEQRDMSHRGDDTPFTPANARLISLSMSSPLEVVLSVGPGWLALMLAFIVGYDKIHANMDLIRNDVRKGASKIKGLSEDRTARLQVSAGIFLSWLLSHSEQNLENLQRRIQRIRASLEPKPLSGDDEIEWFEVEVIEEKDSDFHDG